MGKKSQIIIICANNQQIIPIFFEKISDYLLIFLRFFVGFFADYLLDYLRLFVGLFADYYFLSLPINPFCVVVQNDEFAVDLTHHLRLTPGFGPGPQAATPFGQTMRCPASIVLPPSSCFPPKIPQARSPVRVPILVHGNFLAI